MRYVYFDAFSGISGDMVLGALLDLGIKPAHFKEKMAGLGLPVNITVRRVKRGSLSALKVDVRVERKHPVERKFADVERIVLRAPFSDSVRNRAIGIFRRLYEAEAKVHGRRFRETHLHEAGADDALIDIVGCSYLADALDLAEFYASPLNVGSGQVETAHGLLPVPPPAVAELLLGFPVYSAGPRAELVTPTGAAIVTGLAPNVVRFPEIVYDGIGYGAGGRDHPEMPNVLRVFAGKAGKFDPSRRLSLLETTVDDATPQLLAHFLEMSMEQGALDATLSPVVMKKNRLGTKISLLAPMDRIDALTEAVFRETTALGIRMFPVERRVLDRSFEDVMVAGHRVGVKIGSRGGRRVNIQPEYEDCLKVSRKTRRPLKEVVQLAVREYYRKR